MSWDGLQQGLGGMRTIFPGLQDGVQVGTEMGICASVNTACGTGLKSIKLTGHYRGRSCHRQPRKERKDVPKYARTSGVDANVWPCETLH